MTFTDKNLTQLKKIFATKDEFYLLKLDVEELKHDVSINTKNISLLREDVNQIKDDVSAILHELRTEHRIRQLRIEDNIVRIQRLEDDFANARNN